MKRLNEGRRFTTDAIEVSRIAFVVEPSDVGKSQNMYLGQTTYTFAEDDVGRLIEVVKNVSPGFVSWRFGSIFTDLTDQYPDPKPYVGAPSASE